jgi:hypothetical protein
MNAPRDLGPDFRSWLEDVPPMPPELPARTLDETRHTRQRRRWLWFLPGPKPTAGADDPGSQDQLVSTNDDYGGTRLMFPAARFIAIAASVALMGALTLALQLGFEEGTAVPAAQAPYAAEITPYTSVMETLGQDRTVEVERLDWGNIKSGEQWTARYTSSDPRMSGVATSFSNVYEVGPSKTYLRVYTGRLFTRDEDGRWLQKSYGYQNPETTAITYITHSTGEGAYAGLSAYDTCEQKQYSARWDCHGVIFEGEWPEFPPEAPEAIPEIHLAP